MRYNPYADTVTAILQSMGGKHFRRNGLMVPVTEADPRHILGFMYLEHSTLDGLSIGQFRQEVEIGLSCIEEGGIENAEKCAQSWGL